MEGLSVTSANPVRWPLLPRRRGLRTPHMPVRAERRRLQPGGPVAAVEGAVWDVAFSRDPQQKYLYVADGMNMKVHVLDRQTLDELAAFGDGGRVPGEFYGVGSIVTDSKGNIYTGETYEGKRVQKFLFK